MNNYYNSLFQDPSPAFFSPFTRIQKRTGLCGDSPQVPVRLYSGLCIVFPSHPAFFEPAFCKYRKDALPRLFYEPHCSNRFYFITISFLLKGCMTKSAYRSLLKSKTRDPLANGCFDAFLIILCVISADGAHSFGYFLNFSLSSVLICLAGFPTTTA